MSDPTGLPAHTELLHTAWLARDCPSMREIADATGLSHTTAHNILTGRHRRPLWRTVEPIARFLGANLPKVRRAWLADMEAATAARTAALGERRVSARSERVDVVAKLDEVLVAVRELTAAVDRLVSQASWEA